MSRSQAREVETELTRIRLLEADADHTDEKIDKLVGAVDGLRRILVGLLVSMATAAVLLAVNLVVTAGRS